MSAQTSRKVQEWKTLISTMGVTAEQKTEIMLEMLEYITALELELLRNSPYRIGRSYPGKRSIEGVMLVIIIRRALAVIKHLGDGLDTNTERATGLLFDMSSLANALADANITTIDEEQMKGNTYVQPGQRHTSKRNRSRR